MVNKWEGWGLLLKLSSMLSSKQKPQIEWIGQRRWQHLAQNSLQVTANLPQLQAGGGSEARHQKWGAET